MTTLQIKIQKKAKKIQKAEVCLERCKFSCCNIAALQVRGVWIISSGYPYTYPYIYIKIWIIVVTICQLHKCETAANFKLIALIALQWIWKFYTKSSFENWNLYKCLPRDKNINGHLQKVQQWNLFNTWKLWKGVLCLEEMTQKKVHIDTGQPMFTWQKFCWTNQSGKSFLAGRIKSSFSIVIIIINNCDHPTKVHSHRHRKGFKKPGGRRLSPRHSGISSHLAVQPACH